MKIAISGTYSTGKSTLCAALSYLTGIPATHARTMREILPTTFPGVALEQCGTSQLMELGIRRFTERIKAELKTGNKFVSDGCSLQEWLYGSTRIKTGLNPSENPEKVSEWISNNSYEWQIFQQTIGAFEKVTKDYAKKNYDVFIHLPVEFPFTPDGHRPTSEIFRNGSDKSLRQAYDELNISPFEIGGNMYDRLNSIIKYLNIKTIMSIESAIDLVDIKKKSGAFNIQIEERNAEKSDLFDSHT